MNAWGLDRLPRVRLAHLPTPLEPLPRLTDQMAAAELWIKRDDLTGLATGGNKARKLEFLAAAALAERADTLITCGAAQSNHARQTAAAAAKLGLAATLVLRGQELPQMQGNLLLDRLLGADVVWAQDQPIAERMTEVAADLRRSGRRPYVVPYGGSDAIGASGYAAALAELLAQSAAQDLAFDSIVVASSSGGTQAGLVVGARALGYAGRILGISVDLPAEALRRRVAGLATETAALLDVNAVFALGDVEVDDSYVGAGYGMVSQLERGAIQTMAHAEGILLDPVYTGRAFGGLLDLIGRGAFPPGQRVLFWHTGGTAGVFGYGSACL
ncbi:MAG: D-cysteine desulfhydrase family protein [Anaerolineales bacterium]|nr:D-cysteine desulfhydrase family protein [Anaerolineales bacterium]